MSADCSRLLPSEGRRTTLRWRLVLPGPRAGQISQVGSQHCSGWDSLDTFGFDLTIAQGHPETLDLAGSSAGLSQHVEMATHRPALRQDQAPSALSCAG